MQLTERKPAARRGSKVTKSPRAARFLDQDARQSALAIWRNSTCDDRRSVRSEVGRSGDDTSLLEALELLRGLRPILVACTRVEENEIEFQQASAAGAAWDNCCDSVAIRASAAYRLRLNSLKLGEKE